MLRKIGGVVAGLLAAFVIIFVAEMINSKVYPLPHVNLQDKAAMAAMMKSLPIGALIFVLCGWALGTLIGSLLAAKIAHSRIVGAVVGALLFIAAILNMIMIPHPGWFMGTAFALFFAAALAGSRLGAPPRAAVTA